MASSFLASGPIAPTGLGDILAKLRDARQGVDENRGRVYTMAYSLPVNPPGTGVVLTRERVWDGLVMKAENALPFVPSMQECTVLERFAGGLVRRVVVNDETWIERITFTEPVQVLFERTDAAGAPAGWIANVLSESEAGLLLTFVLNVVTDPGDARARGEAMKTQYVGAIDATLRKTRELFAQG
jgi:hypothetical protein